MVQSDLHTEILTGSPELSIERAVDSITMLNLSAKLWALWRLRKDAYFFLLKNLIRFIVCPMANAIIKNPIFPCTPPNGLCSFSMSQWIKVAKPDMKVRIYNHQSMRVGTLSLLNFVSHFFHWK